MPNSNFVCSNNSTLGNGQGAIRNQFVITCGSSTSNGYSIHNTGGNVILKPVIHCPKNQESTSKIQRDSTSSFGLIPIEI